MSRAQQLIEQVMNGADTHQAISDELAEGKRDVIKAQVSLRVSGDYKEKLDMNSFYSDLKPLMDKALASLKGKVLEVNGVKVTINDVGWTV